MRYVMTSPDCLTGTDRVYEVAQQIPADIYINVQGDEPLVEPADIRAVIEAVPRYPGEVLNAFCPVASEDDFRSPNLPKVVFAPDRRLLYMSRAGIPVDKKLAFHEACKQVCIYAFTFEALSAFAGAGGKTPLEAIEDIEILRFLELGIAVRMVPVSAASIAVDVPEDIVKVQQALDAGHASA